jgi:hypothetical protein
MYKGEVNVEYCQLSALLKTAESLKVSLYGANPSAMQYLRVSHFSLLQVKGLAEMTNQSSSAVRDSDRETERLRSHLHGTSSSSHTVTSGSAVPTSTGITAKSFESLAETKNRSLDSEACSPSPTRLPPSPIALYQRKNRDPPTHSSSVSSVISEQLADNNNSDKTLLATKFRTPSNTQNFAGSNNDHSDSTNINNNNEDCNMSIDERNNNNSEDEDDSDVKMKNEMGELFYRRYYTICAYLHMAEVSV